VAEDGAMLALACVLGIVESWIPSPVPGIRLGLANAAVLVVLLRGGWARAARVSLARVAIVGVATGTLLGPVSALSLAGAAASVACMALAARLGGLSTLGISVAGAFSHVAAQLAAASVLVASGAVAALATPALLASLPLGLVTGSVAGALISRLEGICRRVG
jgi:heptaprenyl diphosphate synthase